MVDAEASLLPNGTKEGDVLKFDDGIYAIDAEPTLERARCVKQLMGELWKGESPANRIGSKCDNSADPVDWNRLSVVPNVAWPASLSEVCMMHLPHLKVLANHVWARASSSSLGTPSASTTAVNVRESPAKDNRIGWSFG